MNLEPSPPKRPYVKPEIVVLDYAADEVMYVGCKVAGGGPSKKPGPGCGFTKCFDLGS